MTVKTPTQILAEINGEIVPGVAGGITAPTVNEILADIVNSFQPIGQANLINAGFTPVANFPTNTLLYSNGMVVEAATVGAGLGFSNGVLFSTGGGGGSGSQFDTIAAFQATAIPPSTQDVEV